MSEPDYSPQGDPMREHVDWEEFHRLRLEEGVYPAKRIAYRSAAARLLQAKAEDPDADHDLLTLLHYSIFKPHP